MESNLSQRRSTRRAQEVLEEYRELTSPARPKQKDKEIEKENKGLGESDRGQREVDRERFGREREREMREEESERFVRDRGVREREISKGRYEDLVTELETMEQALVQHVRTAGLKKNREMALIEEILTMKRTRRQTMSLFIKELDNLSECCSTTEQLLQTEKEKHQKKFQLKSSEYSAILEEKSRLIEKLEMKYKSKIESLHVKYHDLIQEERQKVAGKYETRLNELEAVVSRVQTVKEQNNSNQQQNQQQMIQLREEMKQMEQKYQTTLEKYKIGIKALMEKEQSLEISLSELQAIRDRENQQKSHLLSRCELLEEEVKALSVSLSTVNQFKEELEKKYHRVCERYRQEKEGRDRETETVRSETEHTIEHLRVRHDRELEAIDERVRQALRSKDEMIDTLRNELKGATERYQQAEELLLKLNQDLILR